MLRARVPAILAEWQVVACDEPWRFLPEAHRIDALPNLLRRLVDAALCTPGGREAQLGAYEEVIVVAAAHGSTRRAQAFPQELRFVEYYCLREAIWRVLQREAAGATITHEPAQQAILWVDVAMTLATRASLHGFHRSGHAAQETWDAVIGSIREEAVLLVRQRRGA